MRSWRATSPATATSTSPSPTRATTTVSVLLGNGDGTFQPQVTYAVGSVPDAIVAGDFTGDGRLDLAVANAARRHGVGAAGQRRRHLPAARSPNAVGSYPDAIVAGDFNGDGRLDLAVANAGDDTVSVLLGNGDGTFQPQVTYAVGSSPTPSWRATSTATAGSTWPSPTWYDDTVSVLLGNGDGTFQPQVTYAVGSDPDAIVAGDFTGDGQLDLAVANDGDDTVSVLLGNGDGTFQPQVTYAVGIGPGSRSWRATSPATASSTWPSPTTSRRHGVGAAGQRRRHLPAPGHLRGRDRTQMRIVAGDFTGDGRLDLAVANDGCPTAPCRCCWATATAPSSPRSLTRWGRTPMRIVAGDFNGDGQLDLAVANVDANDVSVLLGNGDGTFQPQVTYAVGIEPDAIVAGDFNGDGRTRPGRRQL